MPVYTCDVGRRLCLWGSQSHHPSDSVGCGELTPAVFPQLSSLAGMIFNRSQGVSYYWSSCQPAPSGLLRGASGNWLVSSALLFWWEVGYKVSELRLTSENPSALPESAWGALKDNTQAQNTKHKEKLLCKRSNKHFDSESPELTGHIQLTPK